MPALCSCLCSFTHINICQVLCQDINFIKVSLPEETIQRLITGITQDLQGNIWFGSGGVHKFDGVQLKSYIHDPLNPASLSHQHGGVPGFGLSLAYDIVKAHGGELKVETKEGEGSEFIIQLPAV